MLDDPAMYDDFAILLCNEVSMERGGKMTYVSPTMTEEDAREDSIALVQRRTNRLHWNSAMRRRYYQHG